MEKAKHIYNVKVIGKNSAGGTINTTKTDIHASTEAEAKRIAKERCKNFFKITDCIVIKIK